ncbi:hypothetical protein E5D57_009940 [Metarhizium anisopliae]|nr:hypothetical protein E5D57_009940 [Metarhizium anisopliae]
MQGRFAELLEPWPDISRLGQVLNSPDVHWNPTESKTRALYVIGIKTRTYSASVTIGGIHTNAEKMRAGRENPLRIVSAKWIM